MAESFPLWLKLVLRAERIVGTRVESAVHSDTYFDVVIQARRSMSRVTGTTEGISKRILHLANLPAGTDIRRVREQLARMERRMVELSKELDELGAARESVASQTPREATATAVKLGPAVAKPTPDARGAKRKPTGSGAKRKPTGSGAKPKTP